MILHLIRLKLNDSEYSFKTISEIENRLKLKISKELKKILLEKSLHFQTVHVKIGNKNNLIVEKSDEL